MEKATPRDPFWKRWFADMFNEFGKTGKMILKNALEGIKQIFLAVRQFVVNKCLKGVQSFLPAAPDAFVRMMEKYGREKTKLVLDNIGKKMTSIKKRESFDELKILSKEDIQKTCGADESCKVLELHYDFEDQGADLVYKHEFMDFVKSAKKTTKALTERMEKYFDSSTTKEPSSPQAVALNRINILTSAAVKKLNTFSKASIAVENATNDAQSSSS